MFSAKHPDVGQLHIMDDGCEATIFVGEITHSHFNPYDSELNQEGIDLAVTESVLDFLEDVFADRMLLWKARNGGSGGCQSLGFEEVSKELIEKADCYVWSGPYSPND